MNDVQTAKRIIEREYGHSTNFMTPEVLDYGLLRVNGYVEGAWELSQGRGFEHEPIFGVTIVEQFADESTKRRTDLSEMFHSKALAYRHISKIIDKGLR